VKRVFDASSIFEIAKQADASPLINGHALYLTVYELGNILWKHTTLTNSLSVEEAEETRQILNKMLQMMKLLPVSNIDHETIAIASKHSISYYDASYIQATKSLNADLITEDKHLSKVATSYGVPTHPASTLHD
jgi:predicted nucleic acid-binding protein